MNIRQATLDDLDALIPLFDGYRQFYGQPSDPSLARSFLSERFIHHQSVVFIALDAQQHAVGFTQLFPSFSSISAARIFVLNDLFVSPAARRSGVASALLRAAADFGRAAHAIQLELSTAETNSTAQALYESEGWRRGVGYYVYELLLQSPGNA